MIEARTDDPNLTPETPEADTGSSFATASQWQLVRRKFLKHRLAVVSLFVLGLFYGIAVFAEFLAPNDPLENYSSLPGAPPQRVRLSEDGRLQWPFVYGYKSTMNIETMRFEFEPDPELKFRVGFLVRTEPYKLWGALTLNRKFAGVIGDEGYVFFLGTDRLGRDMISRIIYGMRISLSVGLLGVLMSFFFGLAIGGVSGLMGGVVDGVIQRLIEILMSFPTIPLWMALAAALPREWPQLWVFFGITIILSLLGWTDLARVVRGKFLSLRDDDYVIAARLAGAGQRLGDPQTPAPRLHEPHHRLPDAVDPGHDPGRDGPLVPGTRAAATHDQLGGASAGSAEHPQRGADAVGVHPRLFRNHRGAGVQLRRRRHARCGGPL